MISEDQKRILSELRKNSRASLKELAQKINLPSSTVHDRVKRYQGKIIRKHTSLLNFQEMGYRTHLFLAMKTKRVSRDELENFLRDSGNVNSIYQVNDQFDYLVEAIFKDAKEAHDFLEQLRERFVIETLYVHNVISNPKKEEFLIE